MNNINEPITHVTDYQFEVAAYYLGLLEDDEAIIALLDMKICSDVYDKLCTGIPIAETFNTIENVISTNYNKLKSFEREKKSCKVPTNKVRKHEYPWYKQI